ncbi:cation diffusion facilitator family transporter [Rhodococcus sp. HNM0569]|uniref:cation diffusion facilitator family transporter n=1 Tax=Rhodococcus sp. HNM0569 TaxID=2716340 RepID=UPI00146F7B26|nr:cation diffusion facilitator family transporter [Rhodococcus sp. HNM0569]NLU84997.1 cation transporter [Rhodococcus sp. HNM0569]
MSGDTTRENQVLVRFMLLSVATALATMLLKAVAAWITGSVGLLSDALESGVNLVAAVIGVLALRAAAKPPDENHDFGHGTAEYLSAAVEGAMILVASGVIVWTSIGRFVTPQPVEQPGLGLLLSTGASVLNLALGLTLLNVGRKHRSITLVADGKHLLTDVWTSVGVLVGVGLVALFGWDVLDPIVALLVGLNILRIGYALVRESVVGLLGAVLPAADVAKVDAVLDRYRGEYPVQFLPIRTRASGRQRFVYVTVRVPGDWTVRRGHDLLDALEADIRAALSNTTVFTHLEPTRDTATQEDT